MEHTLKQKMEQLHAHLSHLGSVAVAFSSGVDSTFLLDVAHEVLGAKAVAFTAASPFVPQRDVDEAAAFCREKGIEHVVVPFDTLAIPASRRIRRIAAISASMRCFRRWRSLRGRAGLRRSWTGRISMMMAITGPGGGRSGSSAS